MLQDWQVRYMLLAQAELVLVEGMKAKNLERADQGLAQAYGEEAFYSSYQEIQRLIIGISLVNFN